MDSFGLVSIITPSWNCAPFICETIRSIMEKTYLNWELIVSDDCSTDNIQTTINTQKRDVCSQV